MGNEGIKHFPVPMSWFSSSVYFWYWIINYYFPKITEKRGTYAIQTIRSSHHQCRQDSIFTGYLQIHKSDQQQSRMIEMLIDIIREGKPLKQSQNFIPMTIHDKRTFRTWSLVPGIETLALHFLIFRKSRY